ncbi:hypothetical protein TDB9533_04607 [Thalassocella blandensis]|nr:hypothetical protein TDB9533_04607 [Thalassocella blandensis]
MWKDETKPDALNLDALNLVSIKQNVMRDENYLSTHGITWALPGNNVEKATSVAGEVEFSRMPDIRIEGFNADHVEPKDAVCILAKSRQSSHAWQLMIDLDDADIFLHPWIACAQTLNVKYLPIPLLHSIFDLWLEYLGQSDARLSNLYIADVSLRMLSERNEPSSVKGDCQDEDLNYKRLSVQCSLNDRRINLCCLAELKAVSSLLRNYGTSKISHDDLPINIGLLLSSVELSTQELNQLEVGDIVLTKDCCPENLQCSVLINNKAIWSANIQNDLVSLVEPIDQLSNVDFNEVSNVTMSETISHSVSEDEIEKSLESTASQNGQANDIDQKNALDIADLPLTVEFQFPSVVLSLGEVQSLSAGYSFTLPEHANSNIAIKINNKVMGVGQLVNIEGQLGVQLMERCKNGN